MRKILLVILLSVYFLTFNACAETVVPILMYHNINDNYSSDRYLVEMSTAEFEEQIVTLLSEGYTPITMYDYSAWQEGKKELPEKPIIITFDDGYLNNYTHAYPIAKKYNIPITIFVITSRMGMSDGVVYPHFTWSQAKEMEESGLVHIESHTNMHSDFNLSDPKNSVSELRLSKYLIKKHLDKDALYLAYPYGHYTEFAKEQAEKAGYKACVKITTVNPGVNRIDTDLYELKRITACGGMSGRDLINEIEKNREL